MFSRGISLVFILGKSSHVNKSCVCNGEENGSTPKRYVFGLILAVLIGLDSCRTTVIEPSVSVCTIEGYGNRKISIGFTRGHFGSFYCTKQKCFVVRPKRDNKRQQCFSR